MERCGCRHSGTGAPCCCDPGAAAEMCAASQIYPCIHTIMYQRHVSTYAPCTRSPCVPTFKMLQTAVEWRLLPIFLCSISSPHKVWIYMHVPAVRSSQNFISARLVPGIQKFREFTTSARGGGQCRLPIRTMSSVQQSYDGEN
jgi:hypothetical protein